MKTNYRKLYEKHYNIIIPKGFEIHHIDFDRENNNIENLLLIPKKLHQEYHNIIQRVNLQGVINIKKGIGFLDLTIGSPTCMYYDKYFENKFTNLMNTLIKCDGWYKYKKFLDGKFYDVFGFNLSKNHYDISNGFTMYNGLVKYDI